MSTRRSDSAFPIGYNRDTDSLIEGMTKREYFAIMIMQGYTEVKFSDLLKTNLCESICQGCFH